MKNIFAKLTKPSLKQEMTSMKLRAKFLKIGREIGLYSYGCFDTKRIDVNVKIGRYCSFAETSRIYTRNHGQYYISTTPYLYNNALGMRGIHDIENLRCEVSDDVWIGHNAVILPQARFIGRGAIIAAGSIVTKPVDSYSLVGGNPAKLIRKRFKQKTIDEIEESRWWEWDVEQLQEIINKYNHWVFNPGNNNAPPLRGSINDEQ